MFSREKIGQNIKRKNNRLRQFILTTFFSFWIIAALSGLSDLICLAFPALKPNYGYARQYPFIATLACLALLPAVYEELIFRKFILRFLRNRFQDSTSILLSSLLFAVFHLDVLQGIAAFIFGIFLSVVAIRTGSILLCVYAHFLNNLTFVLQNQTVL
jgi:membrane protease YdiL (CAAX protease family)